MSYISKLLINKLLLQNDIIDIISSKINLKKIGNYYKSFCPFHKEKNPSFFVNRNKQFFYCFGCKCYGNIIDFLIKFNNLNFIEAVKELCNISNIPIKFENNIKILSKKHFNEKLFFDLMYSLNLIYVKSLFINLNVGKIKNFFLYRNFNLQIIKFFSIGYSYDCLIKEFLTTLNNKKKNMLFKLGFFLKDKKGYLYDRLYNRITFPIYNLFGNIVAFGSRCLYKFNIYKYINTPTNYFFSKKKCLYNLFNVVKNNLIVKKILIVEGYIDVIMLYKFNITYSVALLGSNICDYQIKLLFFYTNKIIFCFDGDKAGILSIKRVINLVVGYISKNKMSFFVFLPRGEDPDSLIQKEGKLKFKKRINNALSIFDVLFKFAMLGENLFTNEGKINFLNYLIPIINKIKSPIIKLFLKKKINNKIGFYNFNNLNIYLLKNNKIKTNKVKFTILKCLISLILKYPILAKNVDLYDKLFININIDIPDLFLFFDIVNFCINNNSIDVFSIINKFNEIKIKNYLKYLFLWNYFPNNINYNLIFNDALMKLKIYIIEYKLKNMKIIDSLYGLNLNQKKKMWELIKLKNLSKN